MPIEKTKKIENSKRNFVIIYRNFITKTKFKGSSRYSIIMGLKEKFSKKDKSEKSTSNIKKELGSEYDEGKKQIVGQAHRLKNLWKSKEVVQLKTDAIAVLFKKKGYEDKFFVEFEKITKEGYQMMLMESFKAIDAGPIDIQIGNFYYFQHRNFIK